MMEHTIRMNDQQHAEDRKPIDNRMANFEEGQNIQITRLLKNYNRNLTTCKSWTNFWREKQNP